MFNKVTCSSNMLSKFLDISQHNVINNQQNTNSLCMYPILHYLLV